jgi:GDPmannose 4,6-dehydratase
VDERRALITGVAGQDGGYLAEQLRAEGCRVWGLVRDLYRAAPQPWLEGVELIEGDLRRGGSLERALEIAQPDEVYNLASYSQPARAWTEPEESADVNALGVLRLLEALRCLGRPGVRFCQAGTSEMYAAEETRADETTPLRPRSPYGAAKAYAHHLVVHYRQRYGLFGCNAVLFNHESPRRPEEFVTRKISRSVARIKLGLEQSVTLGNLDGRRDWGYAPDYVRAMRMMLRAEEAEDYVIATGESHSVGELVEIAFSHVGLDYRDHVVLDPGQTPTGKRAYCEGDATRARVELGWSPSIGFRELVELMVDADLELEARLARV